MDFFSTHEGQLIAGAHRYLTAARLLRFSGTWDERPSLLQTPVLHLISHGVELLLKFPLVASGLDLIEVKRRFGHNLLDLWNHDANEFVRELLMERAAQAWTDARSSGIWLEDDFDKDPRVEITKALERLAWLHSKESDFALRYVTQPDMTAPRPAFLIDVFADVAERVVKNPSLVKPVASF